MKIKQMKFRNFGPFEKFTATFDDGLVGIVGPNGSGKSTLMEAMFTGPTGIFRKYKNLADYVRDLPNGKKASSGSFEETITHGSATLKVRRTIGVSKDKDGGYKGTQTAKLTVSSPGKDDELITGVTLVNAKLREILGDDIALLGDYAFIQQEEISAVVDSDSSTRTKAIHRLFGLDRFERTWTMLGDEIRGIPEVQSSDDIVSLRSEHDQLQRNEVGTAQELKELRGQLGAMDPERAQKDIDTWESADVLRNRVTAAETALSSAVMSTNERIVQCDQAEAKVTQLRGEAAALQPKRDAAVAFLAQAIEISHALKRCDELVVDSARVVNEVNALVKPAPLTDWWTDDEQSALSVVLSERDPAKAFIETYKDLVGKDGVVAKCPTCGQSIKDLGVELEKQRRIYAATHAKVLKRVDRQNRMALDKADFEKNTAIYQAKLASLREEGVRVTAEYKAAQDKCPADGSIELNAWSEERQAEKRSIVSEYDALCGSERTAAENLKTQKGLVDSAKAHQQTAELACNALQEDMKRLSAELAKLTPEHISYCRELLKAASAKRVDIAKVEERHRNLTAQITALRLRIEKVEMLMAQIQRAEMVRNNLGAAREAFHRSNLPRLMARRFVSAIDEHLQHFLSLMQSNFIAGLKQSDGSYDFHCTFDDTSERDASKLSGGEKVRFSLAFLLAVNEVMAARLGTLALDEPTAQLDDSNVQHFEEVLQHVQRYAHSAGVQVFLITHCQQLRGSFDQTLQLVNDNRVD